MEEREQRGGEGEARQECCPLITDTVRRVVTITCCFLISCSMGTFYTFGNMNPYMTSYLRNRTDDSIDYTDTLWVLQTTTITISVFMAVVGLLANHIHTKLFLAMGFICHVVSLIATYWTVQRSFPLVILTYGFLFGIPMAVADPANIRVAVGWVPDRKGLMCAVVLMGYGMGSVVWNEVITLFINPNNLSPDLKVNQDMYYTQPEVLDNVPKCFLLLGGLCGCIQLLCVLLMCLPPPSPISQYDHVVAASEDVKRTNSSDDVTEPLISDSNSVQESYKSVSDSTGNKFHSRRTEDGEMTSSRACHQPDIHYHPKQMLKSRVFWTMWLMMAFSTVTVTLVASLFKAYGQTFINDDHFLTMVASLGSASNALGRPLWGMLADRFGYRIVSLISQSIVTVLVATFMVCKVLGKVAFLVWVCGTFFAMCGFFTMIYALVFALFGSRYYNINMGLHSTNGVVGSLLTALLAPVVTEHLGWNGVFYVGFGGMFIGVLLNMSLSVQWGDSIPAHMRPVLSINT